MSTQGHEPPGPPPWWRRLAVFATRGNGRPGSVHVPLSRLGLPGWLWRMSAWLLVAADLALLSRSSWGYIGFFVVFPLLWLVHTRYWAAALSLVVFGCGIVVAEHLRGSPAPWQVAAVSVLVSLISGTWMTRAQMARGNALAALAAKDAAMGALARTQDELVAAEHAAGAALERERWAREVHDTLAQGFVSVVALSQAALTEVSEPTEAGDHQALSSVSVRLRQIEEVARENLLEARSLVEGSGPDALRRRGLESALRRLVDSRAVDGLRITLWLTGGPLDDLPPALQVVVLRLVQEGLSNVRRHAQAGLAEVEVAPMAGELLVTISDDGVGLGGAVPGVGLTGMRTRVELLGGELSVGPLRTGSANEHTGTVIRARMPL
ncbi:sensor histidine kinase [Actinomyces howellii]|uniref:Sensor histidine kinase desK n=1 Tax=Actinomyces howellii TaxID=52771 RepID=A0A448HGI4_9ACTO|nr:sensor histidine kinase [Actinomyces howellii]VEG27974.1 Sensor histidine kinase desK [Actinomyces howellii]